MYKADPAKKHFVRHSTPRNPPKPDESLSKAKFSRTKPSQSPIPKLNRYNIIQTQDDNDKNPQQIKTPRAKQRNAYTARSPNPRFRNKLPKSASPPRINADGIIKNAPITSSEAKSLYSSSLTSYEQDEISIYDDIYFLGQKSKKIKPNASTETNHGYDDDSHHYKAVIGDHMAYRFEVKAVLGKGVFGQVLRCFDHKTKTFVAVKVIVNTEYMRQQGEIEIAVLQHLREVAEKQKQNVSVIRSFDYFIFRNHICVSFEVLGKNLFEFCKSVHFLLSEMQVRSISADILCGLSFIHRNYVVHCDLKPENILTWMPNTTKSANTISSARSFNDVNNVNAVESANNVNSENNEDDINSENNIIKSSNSVGANVTSPIKSVNSVVHVKLIDFGSACYIGRQRLPYIQSRFYRAPEVILGIPYGPPMDVWSFACIVGELVVGKPLFPGTDEAEQLEMYMEVFGIPPREVIDCCSRRNYFFDASYTPLVRSQARRKRKVGSLTLKDIIKTNDQLLLDLLAKCFVWNQNARITAEEALRHPFFTTKEVKLEKSSCQLPGLPNLK